MLGSLIAVACLAPLCISTKIVRSENVVPADPQVLNKIAAAHFAHRYHYWNFSTMVRPKHRRAIKKHAKKFGHKLGSALMDGLMDGIIGVSVEKLKDFVNQYFEPIIEEACAWFGTAPMCKGECRKNFDKIRDDSGLCSSYPGTCLPDRTFGEPCWKGYNKVYCCQHNPNDCTWYGHWMNSNNADKYFCTYHPTPGTCGHLKCFLPKGAVKSGRSDKVLIEGNHCDIITIFGRPGRATCGLIAFYENYDYKNVVDIWYKTA